MKRFGILIGGTALYVAGSLLTAALLGLVPVTPAGWGIAGVLGLPAYVFLLGLVEFAFHDFKPPRAHPYSWQETKDGLPERDHVRRLLRTSVQVGIALAIVCVLYLGIGWALDTFPWLSLQFRQWSA